jgi:predicted Zn-dependent protease
MSQLALMLTAASIAVLLFVSPVQASKRSGSDKDINAIGKRTVVPKGSNWYTPQKEAELGKQQSSDFEKSVTLLRDPVMTDYVGQVAGKIARNSDADMPITVQVVGSDEEFAFTLAGGYQYISRGLLVRLDNECELATVLARGVAHTALHTAMREATRTQLAEIASIPLIYGPSPTPGSAGIGLPLTLLKFRRELELDADYFGVQYLYKSGYNTQCFIQSVQKTSTVTPVSKSTQAFSSFPPLEERVKALQKEITDVLPRRDDATVSTTEFEDFKHHLLLWRPEKPPNTRDTMPTIRNPAKEM